MKRQHLSIAEPIRYPARRPVATESGVIELAAPPQQGGGLSLRAALSKVFHWISMLGVIAIVIIFMGDVLPLIFPCAAAARIPPDWRGDFQAGAFYFVIALGAEMISAKLAGAERH